MMIRGAVRAIALAIVASAALVAAPSAGAAPVDLTSVTESNRLVSASWTLPAGASAWTLEISVDTAFDFDSVREYAQLGATETSFTSSQPLAGGTYYVRVVSTATPDACVIGDPSCVYEFSNIRIVTIASQAATLQGVAYIGGLLEAGWMLPAGAESWFAEISARPDRDQFGFRSPIAASPIDVGRAQTSFAAAVVLAPGTYYVHIVSTPTHDLCAVDDPACVFEYSNIVPVPVPAAGRPASLPSSPSLPASDKVLALGAVTASASQDVDKLGITLNPGEAVKVNLSGSVNVSGASKVHRFKTVNRTLAAGKARLRLRLASKAKKAVKRALRRKKNLKAKLTLVVTDAAGNSQTKKYSVRLKP
jgi:hypothetical protein